MKDVMTVRLEPGTVEKLEGLAKATDRTKSFLVQDAVREYLETQAWQVEAIREGVEAADRGDFVSPEKVKARFKRMGARVGR